MDEIQEKNIQGQPIIILGMHRSGTSAIARVLNLLGVDIGSDLLPVNSFNDKGYWEQRELVELNDKILNALYYSWDETYLLQNVFWYNRQTAPHCEEIKKVLLRDFSKSKLWLIKDPRISVLLPIWRNFFKELWVKPKFVFIFRHPEEVMRSITKREGMSDEKAYLLWYHYNVMAERFSRDFERVFISYDDLLKDWREVVCRINDGLSIKWPRKIELASEEIRAFLSADLKHYQSNQQSMSRCPSLINDLYCELLEMTHTQSNQAFSFSEALQKKIEDFDKFNIVLLKQHTRVDRAKLSLKEDELQNSKEEQKELNVHIDLQNRELQNLKNEITVIYRARTWRVMKPVRSLSFWLRKFTEKFTVTRFLKRQLKRLNAYRRQKFLKILRKT